MAKVIVHIDLNAFFVRCEEIKDPSLLNKAVAVGHDGRAGIVSTCSYEARKYGVKSGMPMNKAKDLFPNLIIKPVDFSFYHTKSHEFVEFIKRYTKIIEVASVDEVYADFTENIKKVNDVTNYFRSIQNELFKLTKLKCSIGVGPTKFLAKMGSDYQKPMGLTIIRKKDISKILGPLPIGEMYGIGKKTAPRLESIGIKTIQDFIDKCEVDDRETMNILGKFYYVLKSWIQGNGSDEIEVVPEDAKSIGNSTTLMEDTNNEEIIRSTFEMLCKEVSSRAVKERKIGSTIQIMVKDTLYKAHNKSKTMSKATNDFNDIFMVAMKLYEDNYADMIIRAVGVTLQNLIDPQDMVIQMTLFDYEQHEEESATKLLINELNRKLKKPLLIRASEVKGKK